MVEKSDQQDIQQDPENGDIGGLNKQNSSVND